jgi:hypothetical protein
MKGLDSLTIDLRQCLFELEEFENLLLNSSELRENQDILPFFNVSRKSPPSMYS